jgi:hypothetical protein
MTRPGQKNASSETATTLTPIGSGQYQGHLPPLGGGNWIAHLNLRHSGQDITLDHSVVVR